MLAVFVVGARLPIASCIYTAEACRCRNDSFVIFLKQFKINARIAIKILGPITIRNLVKKVVQPLLILRQETKMAAAAQDILSSLAGAGVFNGCARLI